MSRLTFVRTLFVAAAILGLTAGALVPLQTVDPSVYLGKPVPGKHALALGDSKVSSSSTSVDGAAPTVGAVGDTVMDTPTAPGSKIHATTHGGGPSAYLAGAWQALGSDGIGVAAASTHPAGERLPKAALPVGSVTASVLSPGDVKRFGLSGLVLKLARADGSQTVAPVAVRIPTHLLDGMFGADYASRLRWVQIPVPSDDSPKSVRAAKAKAEPVATTSAGGGSSTALVATPFVASSSVMLVPLSSPVSSTGTGSFTATSLAPSSSWQVSAQTGDFAWSYPMRTPPAAAGPSPSLALNYDSQSVDGETGSTNNQPSAIGEGWSLAGGGSIERTYVSCSLDDGASGPVTTSGDLCWKTDNATISFAGHSGTLVKDSATGVWKLQADDGSRIQHLVGAINGCGGSNGTYDDDCWRVTTTDGTQYYFGLNQLPGWASGKATTNSAWTVPVYGNDAGEPCHGSSFAASSCTQAWRWNLDYVVDVHGNAEALYYDAETNKYAQNGSGATSYVRGGQLDHVDYGLTSSTVYSTNAASDKVLFGYDSYGRCSDSTHANCTTETITAAAVAAAHPTYYPDVPFDQFCSGPSCTGLASPTFWTTGMLNTVTTQALISGAYANVDAWALSHSFPSPGDGTNAALWLTQVVHTGYSGSSSAAEPATTFTGVTMQNRVWVVDGLAPLDKYRISSIGLSTGAVESINYSAQQCTPANAAAIEASPQSNTNRCFPQWWTPQVTPPQPSQEDLFHKYVVTSVISNPETGGGNDAEQETDYVYTGTPAWRYDTSPLIPNANRTWSVFAGYNQVEVRVGASAHPETQQTTDYTFYQGMDGDRAAPAGGTKTVFVTGSTTLRDSLWFAGQAHETAAHNGAGGAVLSDTVSTPWASAMTSTDGVNSAYLTGVADTLTSTPVSTGGNRTVDSSTTFDPTYGLPLTVSTVRSDASSTCTTITYAPANTTSWLIGLPQEVSKVGVDCSSLPSAVYPPAAISDTRTSYDNLALGATPSKGDPTKAEIVDSYTGSTAATAHWVTASQSSYDSMGRTTTVTDILGRTSTTAYTPAAGAAAGSGALTSETVTNTAPFNWTTTTAFNPAWGAETSVTDPNGKVTTATYDALGRRVGVWLSDRAQGSNPQPSIGYAYVESKTVANSVATTSLVAANTVTSFELFDGLGQEVQTQTVAEGGGTAVTDTAYDAAGNPFMHNNVYWTTSVSPSGTLFVPSSESLIPSENVTTYDGAGRATAAILNSLGSERHRTSTGYSGSDRVDVTPPTGGTPTSTFTNSLGQTTKLVQYLATTPLATAPQEATTYGYNTQGNMASMTDPVGNVWTWQYDVLGRQVTAVDPDAGTTTTSYDNAGNVLTTTDARGNVIAFTYDNLNRKTGEYLGAAGSAGSKLASWSYDSLAKGQLTSSSSYTGSTVGTPGIAYTESISGYDNGYRPTGTSISIPTGAPAFGGTSYPTTYTYNQDGSLSTQVDPVEGGLPAETLRYAYDGTGRASSLRGTVAYETAVYTAIGQIAQYTRTGTTGLNSTYGYDQATGAVAEDKDATAVGTSRTTVADRVYARDEAGDITSIKTTSASAATDAQCFSYDYLQNLTAAWTPADANCSNVPSSTNLGGPAPYWTSYTIDPATGNRTQSVENPTSGSGTATTDNYSYPAAGSAHPHAVQSVVHSGGATGTDSYGYDPAGDTTARPGQTVTYNSTGDLSTVTTGSASQTSIYDASGQLLLQSDGSTGSTLFLGDTELHLAAGSSTASGVRTYASGGTAIAERTSTAGVSGTVLQWLGTDPQNTASNEVAVSTGAVTTRYTDPFGNSRGGAVVWSSAHSFLNAPVSTMSGLVQLGTRAYDSSLGKFLSVDSVLAPFNPVQNNGYSYAGNNPVTASDPSGDCYTMSNGSGCIGYTYVTGGGNKKASAAKKGPDIGSVVNKAWKKQLDVAGQFYSGMGESLYRIGKFFLWDANIGGATVNAVNQVGCLANYASCEAQREAAASPWQKDFWGTAKNTFIDPIWNDFRDHPAHAIGALVPDLALLAVPGGGIVKGASVAEDATAATAALEARASALQSALDPIAQGSRTSAAMSTSEGVGVLASGGRDLSPAQRLLAQEGDLLPRSPGAHAEVTAVQGAQEAGLTPQGIAASRPFCAACTEFLQNSGATITSPKTAWWYK